jgi:AcrR family transcriptional regulator
VLSERGFAGIAVEPLARRLGATKGSFYWHFADRAELIAATLKLWERRETTETIQRIQALIDPRERLIALATRAYSRAATGSAHAAVVAAADPQVAAVLDRVTHTRLTFLTQLYRDLGLAPDHAARRAHLAYALYLGIDELRRTYPDETPTDPGLDDLIGLAIEIMVPATPAPAASRPPTTPAA